MLNPLWPLLVFIIGIPLIVLFWVLISKRKNKEDQDNIKKLDKQIESIRRFR